MTLSSEVQRLLDEVKRIDKNAENYKLLCVRIVERIQVEQENPTSIVESRKWNQKPTKYSASCSGCGEFIQEGAIAWLSSGISPRCVKCGNPTAVGVK